jgi:hypothetical protein
MPCLVKEACYSWRLAFFVDNVDKESPNTMSVGKEEYEVVEYEPESSRSVVWKGQPNCGVDISN